MIAFGGEMVAERARFQSFIHDVNVLASLEIRLVLVHGARPQIEAEMKAKALRSRYAQGLRITDEQALTVKARGRHLRLEIEALLSQGCPIRRWRARRSASSRATTSPHGRSACATASISSSPARCARSTRHASPLTSTSRTSCSCRTSAIRPPGKFSTWRWEDVAESVAVALRADKLLMYTDRLPADREGEVISELTADEAGARPPGRALSRPPRGARSSTWRARSRAAWRAGISSAARAGSLLLELFTHAGVGTVVTADAVEKLRPAKIDDVRGMLALIEPLEADGTLVKRSRELLEAGDRQLSGGGARRAHRRLRGALSLSRRQERRVRLPRRGSRIPRRRLRRAAAQGLRGARETPAASLRPHHARGALVPRAGLPRRPVDALPEKRKALYNWRRGSKVFLKRI